MFYSNNDESTLNRELKIKEITIERQKERLERFNQFHTKVSELQLKIRYIEALLKNDYKEATRLLQDVTYQSYQVTFQMCSKQQLKKELENAIMQLVTVALNERMAYI